MRYILVNDRKPRQNSYCCFCLGVLVESYLREIPTRLKYCGVGCFNEHCHTAAVAIGGYDAPKLLTYGGDSASK